MRVRRAPSREALQYLAKLTTISRFHTETLSMSLTHTKSIAKIVQPYYVSRTIASSSAVLSNRLHNRRA